MKKIKLRKILNAFYVVLFVFLIGVLGLTFLSAIGIPKDLRIYVVETASMEPAIYTGSLIFVTPQEDYNKGDVITFKSRLHEGDPKEYIITHRIEEVRVDNGDYFFTTKGDNNDDVDPLEVNKLNVIGKVNPTVIPGIGYIIGFAKTPVGFLVLILFPAILLIILEILNIVKEVKKHIQTNYIPAPKLYTSL